jgi:murein DD-endopeptidase MepM/ murein hydrolase activator NlpD
LKRKFAPQSRPAPGSAWNEPGDKAIFTIKKQFNGMRIAAWIFLAILSSGLLSACISGEMPSASSQATLPADHTSTPEVVAAAERTATARPTETPPQPPPAAAQQRTTAAETPTAAPTRLPVPTLCTAGQCIYPGTLLLDRPIAPPYNDQVDGSYRFGSTQDKKRDPHHGVELLNPQGTPVLAAADGVVVVAGDDTQTLYSRYLNYYGNLVVLQHDLPPDVLHGAPAFPTPVYTLYAHLSKILVEPGQKVTQGQQIGEVGMTGGATGSHLHFEVRLGENTYPASRNPELWLRPALDDSGRPKGALAVRVLDDQGQPVAVNDVVIQHLPDGPGGAAGWEIYLNSYEEKTLLGQPPWGESFAAGDLPAGWYRISFPYYGVQRQEVQVFPGQVTVAVFQVP